MMKTTLKIEELGQFALGIFLFSQLDFAWWWFPVLLFLPDIGMVGYVINTKIGALIYNVFHHKAIAVILYFFGIYFDLQGLALIGIILFSHASLDRIFGYGLKYPDSFKNTHLGKIGN